MISAQAARWSWLGLAALQPLWLGMLPEPLGPRSWPLAIIATLPLLLPLRGVWRASLRSITWAGYLAMLYLVVGVMEAWASPSHRIAALAQVTLVVLFVVSAVVMSRTAPAKN